MTKRALFPYLLLVLAWTIWRGVVLAHTGAPQPAVHDEFSYLLGADTFAHRRLANPPHALAAFFESPHELARPAYASRYPPGQAMFLALGQVLFGAPFYGVLLSNVFMFAAFCLMLAEWVPLRAGMVVATLFALILSPAMYWTDSYWGGSVAAGAGALVLLAVGIFRKRPTLWSGALFAVGVLLLFWTRPYEGGVFTLAVLAVFGKEIWRTRRMSVFVFVAAILAAGAIWTGYDNKAITGNPFLLPHMEYQRQYDVVPVFWFLPLRPQPHYNHPRLAAVFGDNGWEVARYRERIQQPWWLRPLVVALWMLLSLGAPLFPALAIALLIPLAWGDAVFRRLSVVVLIFFAGLSLETYAQAHYMAPGWSAFAILIALWTEQAWRKKFFKTPFGVLVGVPLLFVFSILICSSMQTQFNLIAHGRDQQAWPYRRAALIRSLAALDRPQLVFVRYPWPAWNVGPIVLQEWVYNSAEIDRQRVVFAHDLGAEKDRALLAYYPDRTAHLLTFDPATGMEKLAPYPCSDAGQPVAATPPSPAQGTGVRSTRRKSAGRGLTARQTGLGIKPSVSQLCSRFIF